MKLSFIFSDTPHIDDLDKLETVESSLNIPNEVMHLIRVDERVTEIARLISTLTHANLHVNCRGVGIVNKRISERVIEDAQNSVFQTYNALFLMFMSGRQKRILPIWSPINVGMPNQYLITRGRTKKERGNLSRQLISSRTEWAKTPEQEEYSITIKSIADQISFLLNADPHKKGWWEFVGFHPSWVDAKLANKIIKQESDLRKKREKQQKAAKQGKISDKPHGKGNRFGAILGVFMGVQMRSQLEIRCAAELERRDIEWLYEYERLGDGNYLVDFYLPQHNVWIEVKGKFEARDHFLLKDVAQMLKDNRNHRLFVFTSGKAMIVTAEEFIEIPRKRLWELISENGLTS